MLENSKHQDFGRWMAWRMADGFRRLDKDHGGNLDVDELTAAVEEYEEWKQARDASQVRRKRLLEEAERQAKARAIQVAEEYAKEWVHYESPPAAVRGTRGVREEAHGAEQDQNQEAQAKRDAELARFRFPAELPLAAPALNTDRMAKEYLLEHCDSWQEMKRQSLYHLPPSKRPEAIERRQRRIEDRASRKLQRGIDIQKIVRLQRRYRLFAKRLAAQRLVQKRFGAAVKIQKVRRGLSVQL